MMSLILAASPAEGGGFNPLDLAAGGNAFWTLVIFVLAVPFIWKIVMGPVANALEERDARATRAIAEAEKASQAAARASEAAEKARLEARAEADKLVVEARARAEVREREIVEAAKLESTKMLENAKKAIRVEQDKAISAIRNEVVDLSLAAASRVLERKVGDTDDRRLVADLVARQGARR
jgi:F-type H+-transporting ATPase subunit b